MMKRLFFVNLLLMAVVSSAMAQQTTEPRNPVRGYVITNDNDTLWGTIDYLTGKENAEACHFQKDGETTYRIYRPGEIQGYRLHEGGVYYVTRTLPVNGKDNTFFAEYLLKGGVSLYRHEDDKETLYYMVDGKGKVATIREDDYERYRKEDMAQRKRDNLREAAEMMFVSSEATEDLWHNDITAENLVKTTRRYNEKYCQDAGDCVAFQYDSKKASDFTSRLYAELGLSNGSMKNNYYNGLHVQMPYVCLGGEFSFPRKHPNLSHQGTVLLGVIDGMETFMGYNYHTNKGFWMELNYGVIYRFPVDGKIRPFVNGGVCASVESGVYGSAGCEVGIGRHLLRAGIKFNYRKLTIWDSSLYDYRFDSAASSFYLAFVL